MKTREEIQQEIEKLIEDAYQLAPSRETACVITKLQEAKFWIEESRKKEY